MLSVEHFYYGEWFAVLASRLKDTTLCCRRRVKHCIGREACSRSNVCERVPMDQQRRVLHSRAV